MGSTRVSGSGETGIADVEAELRGYADSSDALRASPMLTIGLAHAPADGDMSHVATNVCHASTLNSEPMHSCIEKLSELV